jgi:hypothetical protein
MFHDTREGTKIRQIMRCSFVAHNKLIRVLKNNNNYR